MPEKNTNEVSRQARDLYEKGLAALERGALDSAIQLLTDSVIAEPAFLKARQVLRAAQIKKAKGGGAMSKFFGSAAGAPALAKALASAKKEPAQAMEAAERALTSNPFNFQALKVLASAAEAVDLPLTAVFAYETAREGSPDNVDILCELGRLYQFCGKSEKAQESYQRALEIKPASAEAFKGLKDATANHAMQKGNWENSNSYRDLMKDKGEAQSLENAGRIFKDEEVVQQQMAEVYKLTETQPDNVANWKKLGDLSLQINLFDYAVQYYEHAFSLTKGADGSIGKAISDTKIKKLNYGIKAKEEELKADPENQAIKDEIEELKRQRDATVLEECEARAKKYPNDLDIKYELARIFFRTKLIDKAIPEFQAAANNPKNKVACTNWLGKCFKEKGMLDLAIQRFKSASDQQAVMDSLKKEILYNLGTTYEKMGKKAEAIDQFKLIYDVDVNYSDIGKKIEDYYHSQSGDAAVA